MAKSIFEVSDTFRTGKTGRWLSLLTICLLFFMGQTGFAQTVEIGTGTSTNTNIPLYTYYGYNTSQQIVTASELGNPGTKQITKIRWYINGNADRMSSSDNWQVYLGNTTKTNFTSSTDWVLAGNMTQVFSGTVTAVNASWMEITLSSTFIYTGNNLVVAVNEVESGYAGSSSTNTTFGSYTSATNTGIYIRNDSNPYNLTSSPGTGTRTATIARLQIELSELPSCLPPTSLTATGITSSSANLGWTAGDSETAWNIEWGVQGFTQGSGTTITGTSDNPYSLSGLTDNTSYSFYVQADCGGDLSTWAGPYTFTTPCAAEMAPTTMQTFDTFTSSTQPACWSEATGTLSASTTLSGTTSGWMLKTNGFANADSSNEGPSINLYGTKNDWIISNPIDLGATAGEYQLRYKYAVTSYNGTASVASLGTHRVRVVVSTDGGATWSDTNVIKTYTGAGSYSNTGENEMITLNYSGVVKIAFVATTTSTSPDIDFHIDDFIIEEVPSCMPPSGLTATDITAAGADLGWTAGDSETAWNIEWGATGFTQGSGTMVTGTSDNPYSLSGLTSNTSYSFYVQADCGGDTSIWAGPYTFTTLCEAVSVLDENFDSTTTPNLPGCWGKIFDNGASSFATITTTTTNSSSPNGVSLYNAGSSSSSNIILVSPVLSNLDAGTHWLRFSGRNSTASQDIVIGTLSDPTDGSTFTPFETVDLTTTFADYIVDLSAYSGTDTYIGFRRLSTSTYTYVYLDNIVWEEKPSCLSPTGVTFNVAGGFDAQFSWTASTSESTIGYEWVVMGDGDDPSEDAPVASGNTTDISVTATGLSPETAYDFYVRTDCGTEDGISSWSSKIDFTTTVACPAPTALQTTMVYGTQAAFSWTSIGSEFDVEWGPTGFMLGEGTIESVSGTTFSLDGLTPETTYQLYVRQHCGVNGMSTNAGPISFTPSYTATYTAGAIPSKFNLSPTVESDDFCTPEATLTIVVPEGMQIASITAQYSMTAANGSWMEEQNSFIYSPTLGAGELSLTQGVGTGGTYAYPARNLSFAVGATGTVEFVLRAWRTYEGGASGLCNTVQNFVVNNTWVLIPVFEEIPSCIAPTGLLALNPSTTTVDLSWNASSSETIEGYNWFVFEAGANPETDEPVASGNTTETDATATGLTSSTSYDAYVQTDCGSEDGESPLSAVASFTTTPGCGDMFYDNGGPSGNYTNGANVTNTFYPEVEGGVVAVVFTSFTTSGAGDNLKVYDGPDATAPLIGTYSGTQISSGEAFISSHATGALTFVFVSDGFGNSAGWAAQIICLCEGVWVGGESTDWSDADNWCGASLPTAVTDVIVLSSNPAVINSDVTVASIGVGANASVTVNGSLSTGTNGYGVQPGGELLIASGGNLLQAVGATNSGNISVERDVTIKHLDYTVWSSPVTGQGLQAFSPETLPNRIRIYDTDTDAWTVTTGSFTAGFGYMFRAPNVFDAPYPNAYTWTGTFTGVANNGFITPTFDPGTYHSVGNPYPSNLNIDAFMTENTGVGSLYFWTNYYAYSGGSYAGNNWATYSGLGGTHASGDANYEPTSVISAGQGFLIETIGSITEVNFTNDMRTNAASGPFLRTGNTDKSRLWLGLSNAENTISQTLIGYMPGATQNVDLSIDAKLFDYTGSAIYSLITNDANDYTIQGRALPFDDYDVVPLGFRATEAGSFTISLTNFDGLFADGQDIFLRDNLTQTIHNLKDESYTFVSENGTFNTRFDVVYREAALDVSNPDLNNNWVVYPKNGQFQIESVGFDMKEVIVYDMLGRTVYQSVAEGSNHTVSHIAGNQVLIVKVVTTDNNVLTRKVNN